MNIRVLVSVGACSVLVSFVILPASASPTQAPISAGQPAPILQGAAACAKKPPVAKRLGPESESPYGRCTAACTDPERMPSCVQSCSTKSRLPPIVVYSPIRECLQALRSATIAECNGLVPGARIPHEDGTAEIWSPRNECLAKVPVAMRATVATPATNRLNCNAQPETASLATNRPCHPRADCIVLRNGQRSLCTACENESPRSSGCTMILRDACTPEKLDVDCESKPIDGTCVETTTSYPREECLARAATLAAPAQTTTTPR